MAIDRPRLRAARIEAGLTQRQLADRLGVDQVMIVRWERGHVEPRVLAAVRLSEVLGTTVNALWRTNESERLQEASVQKPPAEKTTRKKVAAERRSPISTTEGAVMYQAPQTGQITFLGEQQSPSLKVHEFESAEPICGQALDPWRGNPASYTPQGSGAVTCGRCARTSSSTKRSP